MKALHAVLVAVPALSLVACGGVDISYGGDDSGGGGDGSALCSSLAGGGSDLSFDLLPGTEIENAANAFDGSVDSFAALVTGPAGGGLLVGTMRDGAVVEGGRAAGAVISYPNDDVEFTMRITTYLDGALVETGVTQFRAGQSDACALCTTAGGYDQFFAGIPTLLDYDAIEITIERATIDTAPVQVYELCAR